MRVRPGILVVLALALVFVAVKFLPKSGGGAPAGTGRSASLLGEEGASSSRSRRGAARTVDPPVLAMERMAVPGEGDSFAIGRNLFRYGVPKAPPPPPGAPPAGRNPAIGRPGGAMGSAPPGVPLTPPQPPAPAVQAKPQPPPVTVRYLGAFGPRGRTVAVFTDGAEIYDVFEGETFASKYILRSINLETAELGFVGFPDDQTERLEVGP